MQHVGFWAEFAGKVGAPIFAASLVGCLLSGGFEALHGILIASGLVLMGFSHWCEHHRRR